MPRQSRYISAGTPYHVTQRGVRKSDVFFSSLDRMYYLKLIREKAVRYGVEVLAYCLMTTHVHHVLVPKFKNSLGDMLRCVHSRYANRINKKMGWTGHLWQCRYFACPLDGIHLPRAIRYVELNPVRANMVKNAGSYPWSSAFYRINNKQSRIITKDPYWKKNTKFLYRGLERVVTFRIT